jgi:dTDP-glucose 4,6-dehydratase
MKHSELKDKVFLIGGAAGFIPSTLAEFYLKLGAKVIGIDNFATGSKSNVEILSKYDNFTFIESCLFSSFPTEQLKEFPQIDFIYSLASPASPVDFKLIPLEIMRVNSEGTMNLLNLARERGARFLEASTSEVYGDPELHPQPETYFGSVNPIGPRSCYDESKRYAEALTMSYHDKFGVDTRIVRIFNTYGPRMRPDDGRVIPNFINQALKGEDITVYGDGTQTRSFCFVTDLVNAMHEVMFCHDHTPVNIGNPDEYLIRDVAELIVMILESKSKIITEPLPADDPKKRRPDISKLLSLTPFKPQVSFKDGLRQTAEYFLGLGA